MSTTTEKAPRTLQEPRKRRLYDLRRSLIAPDAETAPKAVREAAATAREAYESYEQARYAYREAEQEAEDAPQQDKLASAAALAKGEDPPERIEPEAQRQLGEANRNRQAAEHNAREAIHAQADAMRGHYGEWIETQEQQLETRRTAALELIDRLNAELAGLEVDQQLLEAIRGFGGSAESFDLRLPAAGRRESREQRAREEAEAHLQLRPSEVPSRHKLAAELRYLVEGRAGA